MQSWPPPLLLHRSSFARSPSTEQDCILLPRKIAVIMRPTCLNPARVWTLHILVLLQRQSGQPGTPGFNLSGRVVVVQHEATERNQARVDGKL